MLKKLDAIKKIKENLDELAGAKQNNESGRQIEIMRMAVKQQWEDLAEVRPEVNETYPVTRELVENC